MREDIGFYLLLVLPIILLAVWAGYMLATRRKAKGGAGSERADRTERKELTGPEQHKRRRLP
jgi:hypothetical protein